MHMQEVRSSVVAELGTGYILYASDDSDASLSEAKEYIESMGLTKEQVSLIRREGMIMVRVK